MADLSRLPIVDGFETTLAQSWDGATGTVYLNDTPTVTLGSNTTCITVEPWKTNMQTAVINAINTSADTVTVSSIAVNKWAGTAYSQVPHPAWSKVIISDNYQFWEDIQTSLATKVNKDIDSIIANNVELQFGSTSAAIYTDDSGVNMYFKDGSNPAIDLSSLAAGAWADTKVSVSVNDTTPAVLDSKVTVSAPITKAITSPWGDEKLNLAHDFTDTDYYVSTSTGAADEGKIGLLDSTGKLDSTMLPTYPSYNVEAIVFSYDTSTASGTQVINHNLGVAPQSITFQTLRGGDYCFGGYDGTNNVCIYWDNSNATTTANSSSYCIRSDDSVSDFATAVVSAVSTTTFTLTWTKTGSANGTLNGTAMLVNIS